MGAAVMISVLLSLSILIVRIGAVAMRLTGLPDNVARFQCLSALTGTGFTTTESEMIVNYPLRRRILMSLMVIGNLGIVSVAATFIVSFMHTTNQAGEIIQQLLIIVVAGVLILTVMLNKGFDRVMCKAIGSLLLKTTSLGTSRFHLLLQIGNGMSIAEHMFSDHPSRGICYQSLADLGLVIMAVHGEQGEQFAPIPMAQEISPGDTIICFGSDQAHGQLEDLLGSSPGIRTV